MTPGATGAVLVLAAALASDAAPPHVVRIMPLGDSITEGATGDVTWRYLLQKNEAAGCAIDYVGSRRGVLRGEPRFPDFDLDHEGHWGWTTAEVRAQIDDWARRAKPDVVLLHLGTNDLGRDPEAIAGNLAAIVESLRRANPKVTVFVARLIPAAGVPPETLTRTNDAIARMAAARTTADSPLVVVDQTSGFDVEVDTGDGLHPNDSGARKMAARWFEALAKRLGCARGAPPTSPAPSGSPGTGSSCRRASRAEARAPARR